MKLNKYVKHLKKIPNKWMDGIYFISYFEKWLKNQIEFLKPKNTISKMKNH